MKSTPLGALPRPSDQTLDASRAGGTQMSTQRAIRAMATVVLILSGAREGRAMTLTEAMVKVADRLVAKQVKVGVNAGIWPLSVGYTGPIGSGVAAAYMKLCDGAYGSSAQLAGDYILFEGHGNYYGDAAYTLTLLSEMSEDPADNVWRTVLEDFYFNIAHDPGGTPAYVAQYSALDISEAVIYIAHHVIASHYVNAADAGLWRQALIDWLAEVDDNTYFPVMAMAAATWALAETGPMDATLIDPSGDGAPYWNLRRLSGLPSLLLSHQAPAGHPYAGSFYARFDHTNDGGAFAFAAGYTEDTAFAVLALAACRAANPVPALDAAVVAGRNALFGAIAADGSVWEHISKAGQVLYVYAGELLQALAASSPAGDLDVSGRVDFADVALMAGQYLADGCQLCSHDNADVNRDGVVNLLDMAVLADNWLSY